MFDKLDVGPNAFAVMGVSSDKIRWSGVPDSGLKLRKSDAFAIPFSLMWGGFAIVWEAMALTSDAPFFFRLWGVPFVLMGLYLIVGRFFWDAYARSNTAYALTDDSALILRRGLGGSMSTVYLPSVYNLNLSLAPDGSGTITFGDVPSWYQEMPLRSWNTRNVSPSFAYIRDAAAVYERCKAAQRFRKDQLPA